jgi:aspartate/methionine/tyrosine aminotransferase
MNVLPLLSQRSSAIQESVIRRVFEEARDVRDPINLTLGQPDFPVPDAVKEAAVRAVREDRNGYSSNRGVDALLARIAEHLRWDLGWDVAAGPGAGPGQAGLMVTSGTSGGLLLGAMCLLNPGDEIIIPDPYFVLYPRLAEFCDGRAVPCDTYPDFRMTAERVERCITPRTKAVLVCSPSNPCGVVLSESDCRDLLELCRRRNLLLISDEIYDEFTYAESRMSDRWGEKRDERGGGLETRPTEFKAERGESTDRSEQRSVARCCPSPARFQGAHENVLLIRGFGKTYGFTGWRLGYAAGPAALIERMLKLQMHVYICAPTPLQFAAIEAFNVDISPLLEKFRARRDMVVERLSQVTEVPFPGGAFYAFAKVPERLGMTASHFKDAAKARRVLVVPGMAFSGRDSHFRISYAVREEVLEEGVEALVGLMR